MVNKITTISQKSYEYLKNEDCIFVFFWNLKCIFFGNLNFVLIIDILYVRTLFVVCSFLGINSLWCNFELLTRNHAIWSFGVRHATYIHISTNSCL